MSYPTNEFPVPNACRPSSEQIELKSFQLLCFVSLLSSTATKVSSVVGWTPVRARYWLRSGLAVQAVVRVIVWFHCCASRIRQRIVPRPSRRSESRRPMHWRCGAGPAAAVASVPSLSFRSEFDLQLRSHEQQDEISGRAAYLWKPALIPPTEYSAGVTTCRRSFGHCGRAKDRGPTVPPIETELLS